MNIIVPRTAPKRFMCVPLITPGPWSDWFSVEKFSHNGSDKRTNVASIRHTVIRKHIHCAPGDMFEGEFRLNNTGPIFRRYVHVLIDVGKRDAPRTPDKYTARYGLVRGKALSNNVYDEDWYVRLRSFGRDYPQDGSLIIPESGLLEVDRQDTPEDLRDIDAYFLEFPSEGEGVGKFGIGFSALPRMREHYRKCKEPMVPHALWRLIGRDSGNRFEALLKKRYRDRIMPGTREWFRTSGLPMHDELYQIRREIGELHLGTLYDEHMQQHLIAKFYAEGGRRLFGGTCDTPTSSP